MVFNNHCRTCHSVRHGYTVLGPALFGIFPERRRIIDFLKALKLRTKVHCEKSL